MQDQADYVTEAMELLEETSIEIAEPHKVIERRGGKLIESDRPAFVKLYTDFKRELKTMDGDALKVWLYLALSINRYTKDARPGLRKISEDVGLAVNTVRAAIERLDKEYNLLEVEKEDGKGNKYHPSDYVSVTKETVSNRDTVPQTVSNSTGTVSKSDGTVSSVRKDSAQLEELESTRLDIRFAKIVTSLEKIGILLTSNDPRFIDAWMEKHADDKIQKAIDITQAKGVRNLSYVNTILAGWLENGYPEKKQNHYGKKTPQKTIIPQISQAEIEQLQNSIDWSVS
jgi:DnaD/phage-associated family protein